MPVPEFLGQLPGSVTRVCRGCVFGALSVRDLFVVLLWGAGGVAVGVVLLLEPWADAGPHVLSLWVWVSGGEVCCTVCSSLVCVMLLLEMLSLERVG